MSRTTKWFIFHFKKIQNGYISSHVGRKGTTSGKGKEWGIIWALAFLVTLLYGQPLSYRQLTHSEMTLSVNK